MFARLLDTISDVGLSRVFNEYLFCDKFGNINHFLFPSESTGLFT